MEGSSHVISGTFTLPQVVLIGGQTNFDSVGANTASTVITMTATGGILGGTRIISVTNVLNWSNANMVDAGRVDLLPSSQFNITGNLNATNGHIINNFGTATWSGGSINLGGCCGSGPGTINNNPGASFNILNNANLSGGFFNNFGTITKTSSGGTTVLASSNLNNTGNIDIQGGTLRLSGATSTGTLHVAADACSCFQTTSPTSSSLLRSSRARVLWRWAAPCTLSRARSPCPTSTL